MSNRFRAFCVLSVLLALALPSAAAAEHGVEPTSENMTHLANSPNPGTTNSDIAFWEDLAFAGNYRGFRVLDVRSPERPRVLSDFRCNGSQGDTGVYGHRGSLLLFQSVDRRQTRSDCASSDDPTRALGWEGIRIFDVSNPRKPQFVKAVGTDCGSHTHTVVPDPRRPDHVFVYVSSYPLTEHGAHTHDDHGSPDEDSDCLPLHHKISIVEVPLKAPEQARVVNQPSVAPAVGCHDIGVFTEIGKAAAACLTEGQIWDVSDPANPRITDHIYNPAVNIWHSGGFTWDGEVAIFGDEEGGAAATHGCGGSPPGAAWFYRVADPQLPLGFFVQQRAQAPQGDLICTTHNYNAIPVEGKYLLNSAFYEAGTGIVDFSEVAERSPSPTPAPAGTEIAHYDAEDADGAGQADTWSSYWYNGHAYANDITRGVDVFGYTGEAFAGTQSLHHLNPQTQERRLGSP